MSKYCGPFVLSKVMKVSPEEAASVVQLVTSNPRYRRGVRGMMDTDMSQVLTAKVGVKAYLVEPKCQLKTWAKARKYHNDKGVWVVLITRHYVLYKDGVVTDTYRKEGELIDNHPFATRKVRRAWYLGELT
jgi:hypothetical protein